ncbi:ABC transporter [Spongiactinospora rosea]|uniref:Transport permease protein n=1 Tax=Spongiactinospora rosea TaxID=2248750 RepID=A0A366LWA3_9ACTN|nr:ABC transporter permease [Spongiactinospora rosea]RBQ18201.1 ABC transporter [Spongiactinospora rosea]
MTWIGRAGSRRRMLWETRAAGVVWRREVLRCLRNPAQVALVLSQPLIYLVVLGTGLGSLIPDVPPVGDYRTYLFPGVLVMTVYLPAVATGASIAIDRESGFLREMLVAPVHRASLLAGRCAGGTTVAACQGALVLALAGVARLPYDPALLVALAAQLTLIAFTMTTLVTLLAVSVVRRQTLHAVLGFTLTPMILLSGALFPVSGLPSWLAGLALADPLTYVIDPLRQTIAPYLNGQASLAAGHPAAVRELAVTAVVGLLALLLAARRMARAG